jgi:hypothetical protein
MGLLAVLMVVSLSVHGYLATRNFNSSATLPSISISCSEDNNIELDYPSLEWVGMLTIQFVEECELQSANFPKLRHINTFKLVVDEKSSFINFALPALQNVSLLDFDIKRESSIQSLVFGSTASPWVI